MSATATTELDQVLARVSDYVEARAGMNGLHPDIVHECWVGNRNEPNTLTLTDLRALLAAARTSAPEKTKTGYHQPAAGQVWLDNDKSAHGKRKIRVDSVDEDYAYVTTVENFAHRGVGRTGRIRLSRMRPNSTGYRLLEA